MGLASIFESFNLYCNCFFPHKQDKYIEIQNKINEMNGKYDINILRVATNFHLKNLYPITDQVEKWTTIVVGNDLSVISVSSGDFVIPYIDKLLNNRGNNVLPNELSEFLEPIWKETMKGNQLQFFMSVKQLLFFCNSYPFRNEKNEVIGAILFVRPFTSEMIEAYAKPQHANIKRRQSEEMKNWYTSVSQKAEENNDEKDMKSVQE